MRRLWATLLVAFLISGISLGSTYVTTVKGPSKDVYGNWVGIHFPGQLAQSLREGEVYTYESNRPEVPFEVWTAIENLFDSPAIERPTPTRKFKIEIGKQKYKKPDQILLVAAITNARKNEQRVARANVLFLGRVRPPHAFEVAAGLTGRQVHYAQSREKIRDLLASECRVCILPSVLGDKSASRRLECLQAIMPGALTVLVGPGLESGEVCYPFSPGTIDAVVSGDAHTLRAMLESLDVTPASAQPLIIVLQSGSRLA